MAEAVLSKGTRMTEDMMELKKALYKLREIFGHAAKLRSSLHKVESSRYNDLIEELDEMIDIFESQQWDLEAVLEVAADIKCLPNGKYFEWDKDVPLPKGWQKAVNQTLQQLAVK